MKVKYLARLWNQKIFRFIKIKVSAFSCLTNVYRPPEGDWRSLQTVHEPAPLSVICNSGPQIPSGDTTARLQPVFPTVQVVHAALHNIK